LAEAEEKLEQEIEARSRAAELPKVRPTTKREVVLFLREGRLCSYARSDRNGNLVLNRREVIERLDATQRAYIEPRPRTGISIDLEDDNTEKIDERLDQFASDLHYLAIFVWPDSFEHFVLVKDRMVSRQFEYRLIPFPADAKIYFGANEQRVLVQ
jgi:hypothetical protein